MIRDDVLFDALVSNQPYCPSNWMVFYRGATLRRRCRSRLRRFPKDERGWWIERIRLVRISRIILTIRMFLVYGIVTFLDGVLTLWWLPDRPTPIPEQSRWWSLVPEQRPLLSPEESELHKHDMEVHSSSTSYHRWTLRDLGMVMIDWRVWPLVIMYFGVVGVGVGLQNYGSLIIAAINPKFTSIQLSLLFAPIWLCDAAGILLITPFSDRYNNHRALFFSGSSLIIIVGFLVTTLAVGPWPRYSGLLIAGFGLGPTVPICMCWSAELFGPRHGEVGIAAASAIVSGLGNLGSVTTVSE